MKCEVKNCERNAFVAYGTKWICGPCMVKILDKKKAEQNREVEELEI